MLYKNPEILKMNSYQMKGAKPESDEDKTKSKDGSDKAKEDGSKGKDENNTSKEEGEIHEERKVSVSKNV